jgi:hypothetical protein
MSPLHFHTKPRQTLHTNSSRLSPHQVITHPLPLPKPIKDLTLLGSKDLKFAHDMHKYVAAKATEKECYGSNGDCTVTQRSLDKLEAAFNKAAEDVHKLDWVAS